MVALASIMPTITLNGVQREFKAGQTILDVARAMPRYQDHERKSPSGGPGVSGAWFETLYQTLLGQERGPRFGSFVAIYGIPETRALIARALAGELVAS